MDRNKTVYILKLQVVMMLIKRLEPKMRNLLMMQMRMMKMQGKLQRLKMVMPVRKNKNRKEMMLSWRRRQVMTKRKMTKAKKLLRMT